MKWPSTVKFGAIFLPRVSQCLTHNIVARWPPRSERLLRRSLHRRQRRRTVEHGVGVVGNAEHEGVDRRSGQGDPAEDVESDEHGEDFAPVLRWRVSVKLKHSQAEQDFFIFYRIEKKIQLFLWKSVKLYTKHDESFGRRNILIFLVVKDDTLEKRIKFINVVFV